MFRAILPRKLLAAGSLSNDTDKQDNKNIHWEKNIVSAQDPPPPPLPGYRDLQATPADCSQKVLFNPGAQM